MRSSGNVGIIEVGRRLNGRKRSATILDDSVIGNDGGSRPVSGAVDGKGSSYPEARIDVARSRAVEGEVALGGDEGAGCFVMRHNVLTEGDVTLGKERVRASEGRVEGDGPADNSYAWYR